MPALSLPAGRHSHTLAKLAALEAARSSFESAHDAIARRCGPVIGKRQIEESVAHSAADITAFYAARAPEPCTPGLLVVLSADCKGIVMRPGALRAATAKAAAKLGKMRARLTAGEKPNRKRMAALVTVYDAEPARRSVTIHVIIDIIHVLEYIWGAVWSLHETGDPAAEDWVAVKALAVLAGNSGRAAAEITAEADAAGLEGSRRPGADTCVRYLGSKREFLRYGQALDAGWPIATGVIEGACRHLIADRLSIGGARWGLDGAEAILTLRAVISNGDFEEYWRFHLKREHQRLYPGINQGQYALGA